MTNESEVIRKLVESIMTALDTRTTQLEQKFKTYLKNWKIGEGQILPYSIDGTNLKNGTISNLKLYEIDAAIGHFMAIEAQSIVAELITTGSLTTELISIFSSEQLRILANGDGIYAFFKPEGEASVDLSTYVKFSSDGISCTKDWVELVHLGWDGLKLYEIVDGQAYESLIADSTGKLWLKRRLTVGEDPYDSILISGTDGTIGSSMYASGALGTGWRVSKDGSAEFNNIRARGTLSAMTFEWSKISSVGGSLYVAPSLIASEDSHITTADVGGENYYQVDLIFPFTGVNHFAAGMDWSVGDLLTLQGLVELSDDVYEIRDFRCKISAFTESGCTLQSISPISEITTYDSDTGEETPAPVDLTDGNITPNSAFIFLGSVGSGGEILRRGILISASESNSPYIDIYDSTETDLMPKVRLGNLNGIDDGSLREDPTGYGLYTTNAFIKGAIYSVFGRIGGYNIDAHTLTSLDGKVGIGDTSAESSAGDWAFWCGNVISGSAPFRVDKNGHLYLGTASGSHISYDGEVLDIAADNINLTVGGTFNVTNIDDVVIGGTTGLGSYISSVGGSTLQTFKQSYEPTTGMHVGDIWYDTDNYSKPYRYSGSAWEAIQDTHLDTRVSTAETNITANANAITLKASQTDLDTLDNRVTTTEGEITTQAGLIESKASQTDLNTLTGRVSTAETAIAQNADTITLEANKSIGGTNLLDDSCGDNQSWNGINVVYGTAGYNGSNYFGISRTGYEGTSRDAVYKNVLLSNRSTNIKYTLSGWFHVSLTPELDANNNTVSLRCYNSSGSLLSDISTTQITTSSPKNAWVYFYSTGSLPENVSSADVRLSIEKNGRISLSRVKLEIGDKATDWVQSPGDISAQFSVQAEMIESKVESSTYNSKMTQLDNSISTKVEGETYNTKMTQLDSSISLVASQKIGGEQLIDGTESLISGDGWTYSDSVRITPNVWIEDNQVLWLSLDNSTDPNGTYIEVTSVAPGPIVTGGEKYTFSCNVHGGSVWQLIVRQYNSSSVSVANAVVDVTSTSTERYSTTLTLNANAYYVRITFRVLSGNRLFIRRPKFEIGEKATDWSKSVKDPVNGVQTSSVVVSDDGIGVASTGKVNVIGSEVEFKTDTLKMLDASGDRELFSVSESDVRVGADILTAPKIFGNVVNTFPGGTIPWVGSIEGSFNNVGKWLLQDSTLTIPAGNHAGATIRCFKGSILNIVFASGARVNGTLHFVNCDDVNVYANAVDTAYIVANRAGEYAVKVSNCDRAFFTKINISGYSGRTSAANGTNYGIQANSCRLIMTQCCIDRTCVAAAYFDSCSSGFFVNCFGGVVGGSNPATVANLGYGVRPTGGSHCAISGTIFASVGGNVATVSTLIADITNVTGSTGTTPATPSTRTYTVSTGYEKKTTSDGSESFTWNVGEPRQGSWWEEGSYQGSDGYWHISHNEYNGFGLLLLTNAANIVSDIPSGKTIAFATYKIRRDASAGTSGTITCTLYQHGFSSAPSGAPNTILFAQAADAVTILPNQEMTITLNASAIAALNAGTCKGFGMKNTGGYGRYDIFGELTVTYS